MTAPVAPIQRTAGRGRQPAAVEALQDLRDERVAVMAELERLADGLARCGRLLRLAFETERWDVVSHVAGQLDTAATRMQRRAAAETAA